MCLICGWIYDEAAGLPEEGIAPGTRWEDVPMNWVCPECGARKEWLLSRIQRLQGEALRAATRRLHDLSMLDSLTGICNRRHFDEELQRLWKECAEGR